MSDEEKVKRAMLWYESLGENDQRKVFSVMLETLIEYDEIRIRDDEAIDELVEDTGEPRENFLAPYWEGNGESILC